MPDGAIISLGQREFRVCSGSRNFSYAEITDDPTPAIGPGMTGILCGSAPLRVQKRQL